MRSNVANSANGISVSSVTNLGIANERFTELLNYLFLTRR
jgi:hypothetical protein